MFIKLPRLAPFTGGYEICTQISPFLNYKIPKKVFSIRCGAKLLIKLKVRLGEEKVGNPTTLQMNKTKFVSILHSQAV